MTIQYLVSKSSYFGTNGMIMQETLWWWKACND